MSDHDDREAIIALIHRNRIAIWTHDFEMWEACFVHAPYTMRWGWWRQGGVFVRKGFEELAARARASALPINLANAHDTKVENLVLRIEGDMAWASFEQHYPEDGLHERSSGAYVLQELRVFERHDGEWKVAVLGFLEATGMHPGNVLMRLDRSGQVLWSGRAAAEALAQSDDLVVRAGRIRFRDRAADRALDAALAWAARLDSGYMSRHGAVPIVVEAGEGLASRVYWISVDAGVIHLSLANSAVSEERLDVAAAIYGLSPGQRRVAALVAEGLSLNEIAERLGITANTARTHLNRIFEKTGVRNQAALVRILLSAMAPV